MNLIDLDPIYMSAAAGGSPAAQAALAACLMSRSRECCDLASTNEMLAMADVFAFLGAHGGEPVQVATLGMVRFCRSRALLDTDPIRAAALRADADALFAAVIEHGAPDGLDMVARTLSMFAEHDEDEAAAALLGSVIERLPPERAVLIREWSRTHQAETTPAPVKEGR